MKGTGYLELTCATKKKCLWYKSEQGVDVYKYNSINFVDDYSL